MAIAIPLAATKELIADVAELKGLYIFRYIKGRQLPRLLRAVGGLVLAIGIAVLTAVFHGVNAPFGRCCGGGAALTVHSVAAAGGFIHPMGGKEYAYGIF